MAKRKRAKFPCVELCNNQKWRYVKWIHRGKPDEIVLRSPAIFDSAEEAYRELTEALKLVHKHGAQALASAPTVPTFSELADNWLSKVVPVSCKPSTLRDYQIIVEKHLKPALGVRLVGDITRLDIKNFLLKKIAEYAPSTVTHMKNAISGILALAVDAEVLSVNPALALGKLWKEKPRGKEIYPFDKEALKKLLEAFQTHYPWYYPLVATLALAGLRAGEACGLQWEDMDFSGGHIHVRRSLSRMEIVSPKNGKTRKVDLASSLSQVLQEHRTAMKREALARGWGKPPKLVFVSPSGGPIDINPFRSRVWNLAQDKAKLRRRRIHDLRHTFITIHLMEGADIAWVSKQAGHHSIKFTWDNYFHWIPSERDKANADRLAEHVMR